MTEERHEPEHFTLPPAVFYLLLGAVGLGGGGLYGVVGPQLEKSALEACYDNSQVALGVAAQHGEEFVEVREDIASLKKLIYDRTAYRWTAEDQAKYDQERQSAEATQNRRLDWLERQHTGR